MLHHTSCSSLVQRNLASDKLVPCNLLIRWTATTAVRGPSADGLQTFSEPSADGPWSVSGPFRNPEMLSRRIHNGKFRSAFGAVPRGVNKMLDLFKDYAKEVSYKAIFGDSFMLLIAFLASLYFTSLSNHSNILILIVLVYLVPYILYTK